MLHKFNSKFPDVGQALFIAGSAEISGETSAAEGVSIWYNVSIRADIAPVIIGEGSNIQDNSAIHVSEDIPVVIGKNVTVGHSAVLHACTIEDDCLIGMGAIVLDNAVIGEQSMVGAGALVTPGKKFPPRSLIVGSPARAVRDLTAEEIESIKANAVEYRRLAKEYSESAE